MRHNEVIVIPYEDKAKLHIRKDKITATVHIPGSNHIDVYVEGVANPWHINKIPADATIGLIWGDED